MKRAAIAVVLFATAGLSLQRRQYHVQQAWSDPVGGSAFDECPNLGTTSAACN